MVDGCCADPSNCPADQIAPNMCDSNCAEVFEPFWGSCGSLLQTMQMPGVDEYAERERSRRVCEALAFWS